MAKLLLVLAILWAGWMLLRPKPKAGVVSLDEKEARAVLGVGPSADATEIRAAHRKLMVAVHPDRGGSADLARRINAARDVLLK